jgi:hypothetical protein
LAVAFSSNQISLSWVDNSSNENGFNIERATGSGGTFFQIGTQSANLNFYNNTGLAANTTYCYRVRAYNANGDSSYANQSCATTQPTLPDLSVIVRRSDNNAAISNATVSIIGPVSRSGWSNSSGTVLFQGIGAGSYSVTVSASGFSTVTRNVTATSGLVTEIISLTPVPQCPGKFCIGDVVTVFGTQGVGLNIRACAGTNCTRITNVPDGTLLIITGGPVGANGYTWWNVGGSFGTGWAADNWLRK